MRHNWIEESFNLIKTKSALVSQCEEHNLQRAIMWEREMKRWHEILQAERESRGEEEMWDK